ncbi:MAG: exosortase/archaeosortase family protein [Pedosphaera sp.]|nr:exosortase/archaeosortase family protein [Pedosphaera sp.]
MAGNEPGDSRERAFLLASKMIEAKGLLEMNGGADAGNPSNLRAGSAWVWWIPAAAVGAWWLRDLSYYWNSNVESRFGWIVLILTAYLGWERWPTRPRRGEPVSPGQGLLPAVAAWPLLLIAELYKNAIARVAWTSLAVSIACALFLTAWIWLRYGRATWRHFLFPMIFFFVAVPMPDILLSPVVQGLRGIVTRLNVEVLNLLGIPALQQGNLIRLPGCVVGVDDACSGIRSLQSSVMAALFIGDLTLRRPGWKFVFLLAGLGLAVAGNFFRSLYLSITAHQHGAEALKQVHDSAGWSVLVFTGVGVGVLAWCAVRMEHWFLHRARRPMVSRS